MTGPDARILRAPAASPVMAPRANDRPPASRAISKRLGDLGTDARSGRGAGVRLGTIASASLLLRERAPPAEPGVVSCETSGEARGPCHPGPLGWNGARARTARSCAGSWQHPWQHPNRPLRPYRPRDHTIWTLLHDLDGSTLSRARLRAWSGITGWRFESSSAHRAKAPHVGAFVVRGLPDAVSGEHSWQHRVAMENSGVLRSCSPPPSPLVGATTHAAAGLRCHTS
jgi:hypothetical protein